MQASIVHRWLFSLVQAKYVDTYRDLSRLSSTLFSVAMIENGSSHSSMLAKCFNGRKISPLMGLLLIVTFMCPTAELT